MGPLNNPTAVKEACEAISHYKRKIERSLEDSSTVLHCLSRLEKIPVNVTVLQVVNLKEQY